MKQKKKKTRNLSSMKMGNYSPNLSIKFLLKFLSRPGRVTNLEYEIKSVVDRKRTNELPEDSRLSGICLLFYFGRFHADIYIKANIIIS